MERRVGSTRSVRIVAVLVDDAGESPTSRTTTTAAAASDGSTATNEQLHKHDRPTWVPASRCVSSCRCNCNSTRLFGVDLIDNYSLLEWYY